MKAPHAFVTFLNKKLLIISSLGCIYYIGKHKEGKDYNRAARFVLSAFEGGFRSEAAYCIEMVHFEGKGVAQSFEKAFFYFKAGAETGDGASMN